jgi:hypothetical protein
MICWRPVDERVMIVIMEEYRNSGSYFPLFADLQEEDQISSCLEWVTHTVRR